ncbi:MAG: DUF2169 domain-containing protein, partial [Deltaproteobacteria bacterium]|nr:DUF2169 domain-containing protein [Deltaproteobacteria bacterium]
MNIIKTQKQGLLFRTFESDGRHLLAVSALHFFSFNSGSLAAETALWPFLAEQLGKEAIFDLGMPKPRAEGLVMGKCFAPGGRPAQACTVEFKLGPVTKQLYVLGNRFWETVSGVKKISRAETFTVMDLGWKNAFGGPDYPQNPWGKSHRPIILNDGREIHPLPNIEHPENLIGSPDDRPVPAGFGPLDLTWPQRLSKAGTYDHQWLRESFPGPARDMDWTFFNAAPPDQWLKGYLQGNEPFRFANMHPNHPVIEGRLPGFRSRVFINQKTAEGEVLREVAMRAETAWFFPHEEKGVLIHRGTIEIKTDDAEDVLHLMAGYEKLEEEPLSLDHYKAEFVRRSDPEKKHLFILREQGLVPESEMAARAGEDQAA